MAKCKCRKKCCTTKIASNLVSNMPNGCFDVCTNPICGSPSELSLYAPLIYDQIGINLCAEFPIGADISATYPTAVNATASVIDVSYEYGTGKCSYNTDTGQTELLFSYIVKLVSDICGKSV